MAETLPPISFYLPPADWLEDFPDRADEYWVGFRRGVYAWILQTYLHLKGDGFPCVLVDAVPAEGIVVVHWDSLPADLQPGARQLLVCIQADRARHAYAQIHVVQNPCGRSHKIGILGDRWLLPGEIVFMPHWTQPGSIARDPERGARFENVAFFGLKDNLVAELKTAEFERQIAALGLKWQTISAFDKWNDYSQVDAVLAVRSFQATGYEWKPATKLYNAWHAGVPAILGRESAYRAERRSELDYLEVRSPEDVVTALKRLRDEPELRQKMVANGRRRAEETALPVAIRKWRDFFERTAAPAYRAWTSAPAWQQRFFLQRRELAVRTRDRRKQLQQLRNRLGLRSRLRSLLGR